MMRVKPRFAEIVLIGSITALAAEFWWRVLP